MRSKRIRRAGPFGGTVVVVFLLGIFSAPLRTCFSHHGHAHEVFASTPRAHAHEAPRPTRADGELHAHWRHSEHPLHGASHQSSATDPGTDEGAHEGCECLGACHLETAPHLPLSSSASEAAAPASADDVLSREELAPTPGAPHAVRLARGPPALA